MNESSESWLFTRNPPRREAAPLTVSEITRAISGLLKKHFSEPVSVLGELSNFKAHHSGHLYFTLKDAQCELACVMWRSAAARLRFRPQDGLEVIVHGEVGVFERAGKYQLYAKRLEPRGTGELELAFAQLKERLSAEGLFDERHKKSIPRFPEHLAIITSPTGAAIRDMLQTIERRYPCVTVTLCPVAVQGENAAAEIAAAIERVNRLGLGGDTVDVLIVGRGGGSLEDLWAFNEEVVARAIFHSQIPVISAVGHETDVTISDWVADLRAATPTAAAELAVPVRTELLSALSDHHARIQRQVLTALQYRRQTLAALLARPPLRAPLSLLQQRRQLMDHVHTRLDYAARHMIQAQDNTLTRLHPKLAAIEPRKTFRALANRLWLLVHNSHNLIQRRLLDAQRRTQHDYYRLNIPARKDHVHSVLNEVEQKASQLCRLGRQSCTARQQRLEHLQQRLASLSHHATLERGYTVTREAKSGKLIRASNRTYPGQVVRTETSDGSFDSTVNH